MNECFELSYHGGGGFPYSDVWNMPVPRRKYNLKKIREYLEHVQQQRDEANNIITEKTDISKTVAKYKHETKDVIVPTYHSKIKSKV